MADSTVSAISDGYALGAMRLFSEAMSEAMKVVRVVPGVGRVEHELAGIERALLRELVRRLDSVSESRPANGASDPSKTLNGSYQPASGVPQTLAETMTGMLRRSMDQTPEDSRQFLFEHVLRELVPDEARILAALADGSTYPLIDVAVGARGAGRLVLQNASNVGRAAGVAAPLLVPTYVSHLLRIGLADAGQEDSGLHDEYEILLTDFQVKSAYVEAAKAARRSPRFVRRTLRISTLGREFWAACQLEVGKN